VDMFIGCIVDWYLEDGVISEEEERDTNNNS